jgi:hypothetical protein
MALEPNVGFRGTTEVAEALPGAAKASFPLKFSYLFIATFHRRITLSMQGEQDPVESEDWFCRRE